VEEPKEPRSQEEIFGDLRTLAQEEGALHEISAIFYRDWVVTVDLEEAKVTDEPEQRWSTDKLNRTRSWRRRLRSAARTSIRRKRTIGM